MSQNGCIVVLLLRSSGRDIAVIVAEEMFFELQRRHVAIDMVCCGEVLKLGKDVQVVLNCVCWRL